MYNTQYIIISYPMYVIIFIKTERNINVASIFTVVTYVKNYNYNNYSYRQ